MSKKKNTNKKEKEVEKVREYQNPANTLWGKIVIWTILFSMVGAVIFGLIVALINL